MLFKSYILVAALVIGLLGLAFLTVALCLQLATVMTAPAAALVTGVILLVIALILAAAVKSCRTGRTCRSQIAPVDSIVSEIGVSNSNQQDIAELATMIAALSQQLKGGMKASVKPIALTALVAGTVIGYSPRLQRLLKGFIG